MNQAQTSLHILRIRKLIWAYFFLLLLEGVLRKWVVPSLSAPLLIIRDPVALAIYYFAFKAHAFPRNSYIQLAIPLAILCLIAGLFAPGNIPAVALFGLRTDFLHLPLIFIIPKVFDAADVRRIGHWTLLLALPMAVLMVLQFRASPSAWLNAGVGAEGGQISAAGGKIRPAATFSFATGPVYYFAMVTAFLFYGQLRRSQFSLWLMLSATLSLVMAVAVSGSRSLIASVAVVVLCAFFAGGILRPSLLFRWLWAASLIGAILFAVQDLEFMQEGFRTLSRRFENASSAEGGAEGFINRGLGGFSFVPLLYESPLLGYGLGMGTNVGSALLSGRVTYLLSEGEWARVLLESGPILGLAFLMWRVWLVLDIGWKAAGHALRGNPLPLLLFGAFGLVIINGQWGQATTLGFAILGGGLCLASMHDVPVVRSTPKRRLPARMPMPRVTAPRVTTQV